MSKIVTLILAATIAAYSQSTPPQTIQIQAPGPRPVSLAGGGVVGNTGGQTLYYWVNVRYASGVVIMPNPIAVFNTVGASNLSVSNYVNVSWAAVTGATGYDVIRSTTPLYPASPSCADCAVVLNTASLTASDQSPTGSAYPPGGLNQASGVTGTIYIDNTTNSVPYVNMQLLYRSTENLIMGLISGAIANDDCLKYSNGRIVSAGAACGSGSGGAVCGVTITATVLTVGSSATTNAPCTYRIGGQPYSITSPSTLTITAGAGTGSYVVYVDSAGIITVQYSTAAGLTVAASGLTGIQTAAPAFTADMGIPLAIGNIVTGQWSTITRQDAAQSTTLIDATSTITPVYNPSGSISLQTTAAVASSQGWVEIALPIGSTTAALATAINSGWTQRGSTNLAISWTGGGDASQPTAALYTDAGDGSQMKNFIKMPANYDSSRNTGISLYWSATGTASVGQVARWRVLTKAVPIGNSLTGDTYDTDTTIDSTIVTSAFGWQLATTSALPMDSVAAGEYLMLAFYRNAGAAADTVVGSAGTWLVVLRVPVTQ